MGKGGSTPGVSPAVSTGITNDVAAETSLANQWDQNAASLFGLVEPGLVQSENYYQSLASGQPGAISRAIAPQAQQIAQASEGAKANILANAPAGGEKNLALENVDVNRGAAVGSAASGAVQSANQSLGTLASQGIGEAESGAGIASSALGTAISGEGTLGGLQLQGQQLQMEQKGQQLGVLGSLAGDATQLGTSGTFGGAAKGAGGAAKGAGSDAALTDAVKGGMVASEVAA